MSVSRPSLKHRSRNFLIGLLALIAGLLGLSLIFRSELNIRPGVYEIPPILSLYFPASFLLILGGVAVLFGSLRPMKHDVKFCLMCGLMTKHFRTDSKFKDGAKIGNTYVCERCGQKYLYPDVSCDQRAG